MSADPVDAAQVSADRVTARSAVPAALVVRLLRRRLRVDVWVAALLVLLVALTTALAVGVLRGVDGVSTQALRQVVAQTSPGVRDLVGSLVVPPPASQPGDPTAPYDELVATVARGPAATLDAAADVAGPPGWQLTTATYEVVRPFPRGGPTRRLALRVDPALPDLTRVVEGRAAGGRTADGTAYEMVLVDTAAELMELEVGDTLTTDRVDPATQAALTLRMVGVVAPLDATADPWVVDPSALRPRLSISDLKGNIRTGFAFLGPDALPALSAEFANEATTLTLRVPVDGDALVPRQVPAVETAARRAATQPVSTVAPGYASTVYLTTGLDELLLGFRAQQVPVLVLVTLLIVGAGAAALVVLVLSARLLLERRRGALVLARARGTSVGQVAVLFAAEGLALGVPAALAGLGAALLIAGDAGPWQLRLVVVTALAPAAVLAASAAAAARHAGGRRADEPGRRGGGGVLGGARAELARRGPVVVLALVVGLTALAVVTLRRRGVAGTGAERGDLGVDPLVVLTPVVVAVTAALLAVRAGRPVLALAARAAARRPGAIAFLGLSRAARSGSLSPLAVVAIVVGLATSGLVAATASTVERSAREAAAQRVAAPLRVDGFGYEADEAAALAALPGVRAVARLTTLAGAPVSTALTGTRTAEVTVLATDPVALAQVQQGLPDADVLDPDVAALVAPGADPVPVVASTDLAVGGSPVRVGDRLRVTVSQRRVDAAVVAVVDRLAGAPVDRPWVLADLEGLREQTSLVLAPQSFLVAAEPLPPDRAVAEAVGEASTILTPAAASDAARAAPLPRVLRGALLPAAGVCAGYVAAAVVLSLLLGARARTTTLAHLRALGLSRREAAGLVVVEVVPGAVVALGTGLLTGAALAFVVLPVTDLRALSGAVLPPGVTLDPMLVAAQAVGFGVVVALCLLVAVAAGRRVSPAVAARVVEGG